MQIERQYIVDERNCKIAVQIDIKTFELMEELLENYALVQLMQTNKDDNELLDLMMHALTTKNWKKLSEGQLSNWNETR